MTVSRIETKDLNRRVEITITSSSIEEAINKKLVKISKTINIDGFRKGKVPLQLVIQRYEHSIRQDVLEKLMAEHFLKTTLNEKITPIEPVNYHAPIYTKGQDFTYGVTFEIYPDIKLHHLEKIEIEQPVVEISDQNIDHVLNMLQHQQCNWVESNNAVSIGDRVLIDFSGSINGKVFQDSIASDRSVIIGQGSLIPAFEDAMINHHTGEDFKIDITLPDNYYLKHLRNQHAEFNVKLKKIEKCQLPEFTKEFIQKFGINDGSLINLKCAIKKNIERELKIIIRKYLKKQIIDHLIQQNNIKLPKILIDREVKVLKNQVENNFKKHHQQHSDILLHQMIEIEAKKRLMISLVVSQIIHDYNLQVSENDLNKIIEEASSAYEDPKKVIKLYKKNKILMNNMRNLVLEEQAIDIILKKSKMINKKITFNELIKKIS